MVLLAGFWLVPPDGAAMWFVAEDGTRASQRALFEAGLRAAVAKLEAAGKRVYLVGDVPSWSVDPSRVAITRALPARAAIARLVSTMPIEPPPFVEDAAVEQVLARVAGASGTPILPLRSILCASGCAWRRRDGAMLYRDATHLTHAGATTALAPFAEVLFAAGREPSRSSINSRPCDAGDEACSPVGKSAY